MEKKSATELLFLIPENIPFSLTSDVSFIVYLVYYLIIGFSIFIAYQIFRFITSKRDIVKRTVFFSTIGIVGILASYKMIDTTLLITENRTHQLNSVQRLGNGIKIYNNFTKDGFLIQKEDIHKISLLKSHSFTKVSDKVETVDVCKILITTQNTSYVITAYSSNIHSINFPNCK